MHPSSALLPHLAYLHPLALTRARMPRAAPPPHAQVIKETSALTFMIAGTVKEVVTGESRAGGKRREGKGRGEEGREGERREGERRKGKGREGKGRAGKGRAGKGRAGKGRGGKGRGGKGETGEGETGEGETGEGETGEGKGRARQGRQGTGRRPRLAPAPHRALELAPNAWPGLSMNALQATRPSRPAHLPLPPSIAVIPRLFPSPSSWYGPPRHLASSCDPPPPTCP